MIRWIILAPQMRGDSLSRWRVTRRKHRAPLVLGAGTLADFALRLRRTEPTMSGEVRNIFHAKEGKAVKEAGVNAKTMTSLLILPALLGVEYF